MTSTIWEATCVSTHTSKISLVFFVCVLHLPRFWYQDHNQNKKNPPRFQAQLLEMQNPRLHSRPMESISAFQQDPLVTYVDMSVRSCLRPCHLPETASSMWGFPGSKVVKNLPANARDPRDMGSIPGSGRSPGGGNGNPL